jgi:hypothetical protein
VPTCTLTPANGETGDPKDQEDDCSNPQEVRCESSSKEDQDEQQGEDQNHQKTFLFNVRFGTFGRFNIPTGNGSTTLDSSP